MSLSDIYKIANKMKRTKQQVDLLTRKKEVMGLSDEEKKKINDLRSEAYILSEELIETHINISVLPLIMNKEGYEALREIKNIVPWSGNLIRREEEFEKIIEMQPKLGLEKIRLLEKKLKFLHLVVLQGFENYCLDKEGFQHMCDASKVITKDDEGSIIDLLTYLDARYREFGEIFDIYLDELEIVFERGEDE